MSVLEEIILRLLGTVSIVEYLVLTIFIIIGVTASIRIDTLNRDRLSCETPYKFNFKFFLFDNLKRLLKSVTMIFLIIRFGEDLTGTKLSDWGAVLIGLSFDQVGVIIGDRLEKFKKSMRDKFRDNEKIK